MRVVSKTPFVKGDKGDLVSEQNPQSLRASSFAKELTGTVFRPLLSLTKADIYSYASEHSIEYHEDSTNSDTDYDRNRIRADIVPVLRDMHPTIHETIGELGEYMQELSAFLSEQVWNWLMAQGELSGKENTFLIADFVRESEFFQRQIISYMYTRAHDGSSQ
jgi:tRNA(Ile)-lysidine synthase TilS/MesJ